MNLEESLLASLQGLGLDPKTIERHAELLGAALRRGAKPTFKVYDTCRLDNGGLLARTAVAGAERAADAAGYAAFVPAAGAASRYSQPLFALTEALEQDDPAALAERFAALAAEGAAAWPLPAGVHRLLREPSAARALTPADKARIARELELPKALMPCVKDGVSFLAMKDREHARLPGLAGQIFVAPAGLAGAFAEHLGPPASRLPTHVLEQGPRLSTIRFLKDGRPYRDGDGRPSPVPAGHGALAELFPEARQRLPGQELNGLFIRNIDNVMGTSQAAIDATLAFLASHRAVLAAVRAIRAALARGDHGAASAAAVGLLGRLGAPATSDPLAELQRRYFHAPPAATQDRAALAELYARPVNLLGQVPNTGRDVGGTPCFVDRAGRTEKVCIEVPHVSAADKDAFLANPEKATHFNPVFCAVEIPPRADWYAARNADYWLLSEKVYRGTPVAYFETVLYELIGNSAFANCLFIEVPRLVFNPHKVLKDALGRAAADWLKT